MSAKLKLDWKRYFQEFDKLHGGNPVVHDGWLLYRDGFRHGLGSYQGPEVPPKDDEHRDFLARAYWTRRRETIAPVVTRLEREIDVLYQLQSERSAPLQANVTEEELTLQLTEAQADLAECDAKLAELRAE